MRFTLDERDLSHVNASGTRIVGAGRYGLSVGGGQPGAGAPSVGAEFDVRGERTLAR